MTTRQGCFSWVKKKKTEVGPHVDTRFLTDYMTVITDWLPQDDIACQRVSA